MKIIITGATGFIGKFVTTKLLSQNHTIIAITSSKRTIGTHEQLEYYPIDLLNDRIENNLPSSGHFECLIHFAWFAKPSHFWSSPLNLQWVNASNNLVQWFAQQGGRRIIVAGSCAEYDWSQGGCFDEDATPCLPNTLYGTCKHSLHQILEAYARNVGLSLLWCRIFWPYGPGDAPQKLIPSLFSQLSQSAPATCHAGNLMRDYMYVEDVGDAIATAAISQLEGTMNIGTGNPIKLSDIAITMAKKMNKTSFLNIKNVSINKSNPLSIFASTKRLVEELHWHPKYSLDQGLENIIKFGDYSHGN